MFIFEVDLTFFHFLYIFIFVVRVMINKITYMWISNKLHGILFKGLVIWEKNVSAIWDKK